MWCMNVVIVNGGFECVCVMLLFGTCLCCLSGSCVVCRACVLLVCCV